MIGDKGLTYCRLARRLSTDLMPSTRSDLDAVVRRQRRAF
jgi:hypothetical protein